MISGNTEVPGEPENFGLYLLDDDGNVIATTDIYAASALVADHDRCRVAFTGHAVPGVHVSTVFSPVSIHWPPAPFETFVAGGPLAGVFARYDNWQAALNGHARAVRCVRQMIEE